MLTLYTVCSVPCGCTVSLTDLTHCSPYPAFCRSLKQCTFSSRTTGRHLCHKQNAELIPWSHGLRDLGWMGVSIGELHWGPPDEANGQAYDKEAYCQLGVLRSTERHRKERPPEKNQVAAPCLMCQGDRPFLPASLLFQRVPGNCPGLGIEDKNGFASLSFLPHFTLTSYCDIPSTMLCTTQGQRHLASLCYHDTAEWLPLVFFNKCFGMEERVFFTQLWFVHNDLNWNKTWSCSPDTCRIWIWNVENYICYIGSLSH